MMRRSSSNFRISIVSSNAICFSSAPDGNTVLTPPIAPEPPRPPRFLPRFERRARGRRDGDRIQFGSNITMEKTKSWNGDVVAIGGNVTVNGEVRGDVVAVGGVAVLGPKAQVMNNVVVVGGPLRRDPASRIGGRVQTVGVGQMNFGNWNWTGNPLGLFWGSLVGAAFALVFTLTRLAILCLLAALVVLFGRKLHGAHGRARRDRDVKAGAIGLLSELLFVPVLIITIIVLVMTIIGIPDRGAFCSRAHFLVGKSSRLSVHGGRYRLGTLADGSSRPAIR